MNFETLNSETLQSLGGNSPRKRPKVRGVDQGQNFETLQSLGGNLPRKSPKVRGVDQRQGNLDSSPDELNFETLNSETLQSLGGNSPRKRMQLDDNPNAVDGGPLQTLGYLGKTKRVLEGGRIKKQSIMCVATH
ncbi:unnamed protein product [Meganyctiphanes norvegica]|uniref:Uncharacterized protein n=1 Tax=Meganyctiphanes norvegica TaxID=48144 RepID=A0AAV2RIU3_MEGNR